MLNSEEAHKSVKEGGLGVKYSKIYTEQKPAVQAQVESEVEIGSTSSGHIVASLNNLEASISEQPDNPIQNQAANEDKTPLSKESIQEFKKNQEGISQEAQIELENNLSSNKH